MITITDEDLDLPDPSVQINQSTLGDNCLITLTADTSASETAVQMIEWSTGAEGQTIIVGSPGGTFNVIVTDDCGNTAEDTIELTDNDFHFNPASEVTISVGIPNDNCTADITAEIQPSGRVVSYLWSDGSTEPTLTADLMNEISLTVTDACGDIAIATKSPGGDTLAWPDVFFITRPNHEENATFGPYTNCPQLYSGDYKLEVFNRWGKKVFESTNILSRWSGSLNNQGNRLEEDVYMFQANWINLDGSESKKKGSVTMVR